VGIFDIGKNKMLLSSSVKGDVEKIKILLKKGVNINTQNKEGKCPLYLAAENGHVDVVKLLLEAGANGDLQDINGYTALYVALINGHNEIAELLKDFDVGPNEYPIGWITVSEFASFNKTSSWISYPGYKFIVFLINVPYYDKYNVEFDANQIYLNLNDNQKINSCGVIPCLNKDYRALPGQKMPLLMPTDYLKIEQYESECYGIAFGYPNNFVPGILNFKGRKFGNLKQLTYAKDNLYSKGPQTQYTSISEVVLCNVIPGLNHKNTMRGYTFFESSSQPDGIIAFKAGKQYNILVILLPVNKINIVESEKLQILLSNHQSLQPKGYIIRSSTDFGYEISLADKVRLENDLFYLEVGGFAKFIDNYSGPFTSSDSFNWIIVAAFEKNADWKKIEKVQIYNYQFDFKYGMNNYTI